MKKGASIDIKSLINSAANFLQRFHTIIFFLIIGVAVATALFMIILTLGDTSGTTPTGKIHTANGSFDENTIQALRDQENSASQPFTMPSGRTNPFVE